MTEHFSELDGQNFNKLEANVVKLSFQDKFVLDFKNVALFLHKSC